jgi:hypothetical protein
MKSAYELAMERLSKTAPTVKLSAAQKKEIAELESHYAVKIAGREIALTAEIKKVAGDPEKAGVIQQQLVDERKKLLAELAKKKRSHPCRIVRILKTPDLAIDCLHWHLIRCVSTSSQMRAWWNGRHARLRIWFRKD